MDFTIRSMSRLGLLACAVGAAVGSSAVWAQASVAAGDKQVYKCPGNLYTDSLSAKEAAAKGCKTLEGAPVTVLQSTPPAKRDNKDARQSGGNKEAKVDPSDQRARDSDARRILEGELKKEEEALAALKKEFNNGEPERRGDEKNYQKYADRLAEMKAALARKEADVEALKRELAKLPAAQ